MTDEIERQVFRTKPREIEAVQFHGVGFYEARGLAYPEGVCFCDEGIGASASSHAHVHTAHRQIVLLAVGDWISPEPDGSGFYPIKPEIFEARYEPAIAAIRKDDELREWALEKCAQHHRLAVENEELRTEHIASRSAYRELANELERRSALSSVAGGGG